MDSSYSPNAPLEPHTVPAALPDDGPSWLVTFSDLVLQLFAFLLIGLVVSQASSKLGLETRRASDPAPAPAARAEARARPETDVAQQALAEAEVVRLAPRLSREAAQATPERAAPPPAPEEGRLASSTAAAPEGIEAPPVPAGAGELVAPSGGAGIPAVTPEQIQAAGQYLAALVSGVAGDAAPEVSVHSDEVLVTLAEGIGFDSGRSEVREAARSVLEELRAIVRGMPGAAIEVSGHTDDRPIQTARFPSNLELSLARAAAVASFLGGGDVDLQRRIFAAGYAERRPRASNADDRGRAQNRRVEIRLVALR